ncbi:MULTISPECIES: hypothetical protein [Methanobacterium]|jgi:hypothetical protein|uniref:DUF4405 domain-containing protein n=1 Tax=Methanobacterium subterraneum TaxID=59277 RepID=A0A2H4VP37_9EURY|nr:MULTISPECIES: hypothetical protein [Methanobacterium]MBW4257533.1 hypothetical protein [Methanobacterium sp. YSL]PKL71075.1 MAG: hypothetical protein CVV29_12535 [Methanobacteriales archaeon HGW-Methanobacteriales-2]AUB56285.1 hypothetical protein BK007_09845 [Methanobacterium subterraneum]AUB58845.1 hypothetical protein BK008_11350 [Methanobacterium sp. MZ-A1]AUB59861.1 hypothetical protein BK009_03730 [Methanobacterium subterraneum]
MVYDIILPAIPFIGGYALTYSLYKMNLIKRSIHINLWNLIILLSFIISGGAGFLLLIFMELGIKLPINQPLLYWHVELGVTLALVTIFHFHIYWKSAKTMFIAAKRRSKNKT